MRILFITQWFDPEPTFKGLLFAQKLRQEGHEVEVLTGFPNYPGGKVYPGYRISIFQREIIDGISVLRVPLYPSHNQSGFKRALNYLSFAVAASFGTLFMKRPDVAYVYHPPATVGLPTLVLNALRGVPFVYDIQDLWPDSLAATGMMQNATVLKLVDGWMNRIYRHAAHLVVLSDGFKQRLIERGVPETKLTVIPNWTDESQINLHTPHPQRARELGFENHFNIVFAGTMGKAQALDTVLEAAALLEKSQSNARFVMIGGGIEAKRLQREVQIKRLTNVNFLPRRPASGVGEILSLADALLVHLKDDPLFAITIPSKTQAYLMAGKPILMGVRGNAAQLVSEAGAGFSFEPQHPQALADAVHRLMEMTADERAQMGGHGQIYYQDNMSLDVGTRNFIKIFENVSSLPHLGRIKRFLDVVFATTGFLLLIPAFSATALLVRLSMGTPIIFQQIRPGLYGHPFTMFKFRTMRDGVNSLGLPLPDSERLTAVGRFLRASSLDELPELLNVIRGDMSLVGPRPLLLKYTPFFSEEEKKRLNIRPGITGWAQVNGRNTISWDERLELDIWYLKNMSLRLDIQIIWLTLVRIFRRSGVIVDPESTMRNLDDERRNNVKL